MMRAAVAGVMLVGALLVAAAPTQAEPDLRDCVYRDPDTGDITVSPNGCAEKAEPVVQEVREQCDWVLSNPAFPPGLSCGVEA